MTDTERRFLADYDEWALGWFKLFPPSRLKVSLRLASADFTGEPEPYE